MSLTRSQLDSLRKHPDMLNAPIFEKIREALARIDKIEEMSANAKEGVLGNRVKNINLEERILRNEQRIEKVEDSLQKVLQKAIVETFFTKRALLKHAVMVISMSLVILLVLFISGQLFPDGSVAGISPFR